MTSKGWCELHQDVRTLMSTDKKNLTLEISMSDKSDSKNVAKRVMPFQNLPLEQGELVLDDYLCSIYEQLYHEIKVLRSKS